jgi:hypothetical protein
MVVARPVLSEDLGDAALVVLVPLMVGVALAGLGFRIWFGVALLRLRHRLGGVAAVLGWLELLAAASWLVFRVLLLVVDEPSDFDRADMLRSMAATVSCHLLLALLFLGIRDRLARESPA